MPVLERSKKFRDWLREREINADLVARYYEEVTRETWVSKLPAKSARWLVLAAAGVTLDHTIGGHIATAIANGIGAFDMFLLERIARGWRPDQFIAGPLRAFVEPPAKRAGHQR